jgi:hypothetical protein
MKKKSASRSAFFNPRVLISFSFCLIGAVLTLLGFGFYPGRSVEAQDQAPGQPPAVPAIYRGVSPVVKFDVSPPLRDIKPIDPGIVHLRENEDQDIVPRSFRFGFEPDPVVQSTLGQIEIPPPIVSFDGPPNLCGGCAPPDPNGEVGPNHIVVMDNASFQIFNKTGGSVFGPAAINTLFAGFGGTCQTQNAGDPIVLYDQLANRWLLSQFTSSGTPFLNCVAVSTGPDPTGTYFRYAISTGTTFQIIRNTASDRMPTTSAPASSSAARRRIRGRGGVRDQSRSSASREFEPHRNFVYSATRRNAI